MKLMTTRKLLAVFLVLTCFLGVGIASTGAVSVSGDGSTALDDIFFQTGDDADNGDDDADDTGGDA